MSVSADKIRLISIVAESDRVKVVTIQHQSEGNVLTATVSLDSHAVRDEALISVARDWFHHACADIAEATKTWAMTSDQISSAKVDPRQKPPTSMKF